MTEQWSEMELFSIIEYIVHDFCIRFGISPIRLGMNHVETRLFTIILIMSK